MILIGWLGREQLVEAMRRAERMQVRVDANQGRANDAAMKMVKNRLGNVTGAFADGAVLFPLLAALVLPQLAPTLINSVVGTHDISKHCLGENAKHVTPARLLRSMGIDNMLSTGVGGLPFCHGSGGTSERRQRGRARDFVR